MKNTILFLVAFLLFSCAVKKETITMEEIKVYKLAEEYYIDRIPKNIQQTKFYINEKEPLKEKSFVYKNFTEYYVLFPNGNFKKVDILNSQPQEVEKLKAETDYNGTFYKTKKNNYFGHRIKYKKRILISEEQFSINDDTLKIDYGKRIFVKI